MDQVVFSALTTFWLVLATPTVMFGIFIIPATLYGVLQCIKNTLEGKTVKEYLKTFIWTSVGLIVTFAPAISKVFEFASNNY